jgi:hypothetical protein
MRYFQFLTLFIPIHGALDIIIDTDLSVDVDDGVANAMFVWTAL